MATLAPSTRTTRLVLASASAGPFLIGYRLFEAASLSVRVNNLPRTDWTLASAFLNGYDDNASITFTSSLATADVLQIDGDLVPRRDEDYLPSDPGLTRKINIELPRIWATIQEINRKVSRSVRALSPLNPMVPVAGRAIIFNDDLQPIAGPTADEIALAQSYAVRAELASGALTSLTDRIPFTFNITAPSGGRGPYALNYDPGNADILSVHVNGVHLSSILPGGHFTVVAMPSAPSGKGILFSDDQPVGARVDLVFVLPIGYNPVLDNSLDYPSVAALNAAIAGGMTRAAGRVVTAGGQTFVSVPGAALPGMPIGYVTYGTHGFLSRSALVGHIAQVGPVSGMVYFAMGLGYRSIPVGHVMYGTNPIADMPGLMPVGQATPQHMGDVGSDVSDDTAAFAAALKFDDVVIPTGIYRIYGTLTPKSNQTITAAPGATLKQYGQTLWRGPADLTNFKMFGITFDFQADALAWTVWGNFRAHTRCVFKDLRFVRYDNVHIMERHPVAADTINTIDNLYSDWSISACRSVSIDIGLEGFYFKATGDGVTTVYATGVAWGEANPGSVVVLRETPGGFFAELTATDYSVTFPSGNLVVTFVAAPTTGQRIHVWPSNPRTDGNRRPISNNEWRNIRCDYVFGNGHVAVRWVDAETYRFERLLLAANNTACYVTNPYNTRNGQGGDFASYEDCILSYQAATGLVTDVTSVRAFNFGPGSLAMSGRGVRMDFAWQSTEYGTSRVIEKRDRRLVTLAGTASVTTGSAIVTGVGTAFLRDLTMLGSDKDLVLIGPTFFAAIASVDSDTQITLTAAVGANLTNVSISRLSKTSAISYDMNFASIGSGFWNNRSSSVGRAVYGSATKNSGIATILSGTTSITFLHLMRRRPLLNEVRLTPNGAATVGAWVTIPNDSQITISVASAPGADAQIGWYIELSDLN